MNTLSFGLAVVACAGAASLAHAGGTLGTGFADHAAFTTFVESQGKFLKGVEDFEEAVVDEEADGADARAVARAMEAYRRLP